MGTERSERAAAGGILDQPQWKDVAMFTPKQAYQLLQVSRPHFYRLVETGDIQVSRFGRVIRIPRGVMKALVGE